MQALLRRAGGTRITGLALWPEDLRHPFSNVPGKSLVSPDDFKGLAVRTPPSEVSYALMKTFGGKPFFDNETKGFPAAESGLFQAVFTAFPTVTGNMIFYPKFQVLFANGAAFEKLSEGQRSILRQAAAAAQKKAIAEHPSEAEAAHAWCKNGGTIVMASQEQMAAFDAAAKPVFDKIEKNPLNAKLIADIRELKANTKLAPGAEACQPTASSEVWSTGLPPNGKWTVNLTVEDIMAMGIPRSSAEADRAGLYTLEFQDGQGKFQQMHPDGGIDHCNFTYQALKDFFRITYYDDGKPNFTCGNELDDVQWRLDADGLHLRLKAITNSEYLGNKAWYEAKPWQKVSN